MPIVTVTFAWPPLVVNIIVTVPLFPGGAVEVVVIVIVWLPPAAIVVSGCRLSASQPVPSSDDNVPVSLPQFITLTVTVEPAYTYTIPSDELGVGEMPVICRHGGGGGASTVSVTTTLCEVVPPPFFKVKVMVSL